MSGTLTPITNNPGLFRNSHGRVVSFKNALDMTESYIMSETGRTAGLRAPDNEAYIVDCLEVVIQPWPETISPDITVHLHVATTEVYRSPLFLLAKPADHTLDLERRIRRLEAAYEMQAGALRKPGHMRRKILINSGEAFGIELKGSVLDLLQDCDFYALLQGLRLPDQ